MKERKHINAKDIVRRYQAGERDFRLISVGPFAQGLSRADLSGIDLSGALLGFARLEGVNLSLANLREADLSSTDLTGANLSGADLREADLTEANLTRADLSRANLEKALVLSAGLHMANLQGAYLREACLVFACLERANLQGADLTQADLLSANLAEAEISRARLHKAQLGNADLSKAKLTRADLREADLTEANLTGADLSEADLSNAEFGGAKLNNVTLRGTTMPNGIVKGSWNEASYRLWRLGVRFLAACGIQALAFGAGALVGMLGDHYRDPDFWVFGFGLLSFLVLLGAAAWPFEVKPDRRRFWQLVVYVLAAFGTLTLLGGACCLAALFAWGEGGQSAFVQLFPVFAWCPLVTTIILTRKLGKVLISNPWVP